VGWMERFFGGGDLAFSGLFNGMVMRFCGSGRAGEGRGQKVR
jgi:hypothetical protein